MSTDALVQAPLVRKNPEERHQALSRALQTEVATGARIESQSDFQAVTVRGHIPNHTA
jgi:hypothetical protein